MLSDEKELLNLPHLQSPYLGCSGKQSNTLERQELNWKVRNFYSREIRKTIKEADEGSEKTEGASLREASPGGVFGKEAMPGFTEEGHREELRFSREEPRNNGDLEFSERGQQMRILRSM